MSLKTIVSRLVVRRKINNSAASVLISNRHERQRGEYDNGSGKKKITVFVIGSVLVGTTLTDNIFKKKNEKTKEVKSAKSTTGYVEAGAKRPDLPTYRASDVSKHDNKSSFWVTYKHGVYDITKFLPSHPGGEQILNAGGLSVEPFWNVYGMHKTDEILKMLETYRIGNLHEEDVTDHSDDEMWANEPIRDRRLIVKSLRPFNAEIPSKLQMLSLDTPNELFYVRQHMPVPEMHAETHKLNVVIKNGTTSKNVNFKLNDLAKYRTVTVRATLMCAGNRRNEMNKQVKPVKGLSWAGGAISNAVWSGVSLREVLLDCGVDPQDVEGKHVIFTGADIDATGENFSTSIPLHMALDPYMKITLATKMNGEPLPPDHGYPLRVIVPGSAAVRSVKWLESITISEEESSSHWHKKDYRGFNPSKTWETADFSTAPSVYTLPVTSLICEPAEGEIVKVKDGMVEVKGYAYSGGGNKIVRVDVTSDCGKNWVEAEFSAQDDAPAREHYSWTLWSAKVPVNKGSKQVELWVKATDSNFNTQPEKSDDIWNIRGILNNAYHKIRIGVK